MTSYFRTVTVDTPVGLVRFSTDADAPQPGVQVRKKVIPLADIEGLSGESTIDHLKHITDVVARASDLTVTGYSLDEVDFHRPIQPGKIVRLEGCYEHDVTDERFNPFIEVDGLNEMDWPSHLVVPPSATVGPDSPIELPQFADAIKPGIELAFVIDGEAKNLDPSNVFDAIGGCLVTANIAIYDTLPGLFGYKFFDSALPLGRAVVPVSDVDVTNLDLTLLINGEHIDTQSTSGWRFEPGELVSSVSELMTLKPGDLILTGDPIRTDRTLEVDDEVSVSVEGAGTENWTVTREKQQGGIKL